MSVYKVDKLTSMEGSKKIGPMLKTELANGSQCRTSISKKLCVATETTQQLRPNSY